MVDLPEPPTGWGTDNITGFIDNTRLNCFATYANLRQEYAKLAEVDAVFRKLVETSSTPETGSAFFLLRAHSAFLAGAHLAMAGQAAETYASLRLCLENGLYGLYLARNPDSRETWLRRHDSEQAKHRVRDEFTIRNLFDTLRGVDKREAEVTGELYERCIDYGSTPKRARVDSKPPDGEGSRQSRPSNHLSQQQSPHLPRLPQDNSTGGGFRCSASFG